MKLLIGSHNPAKIKYYTAYLKDAVEIVTLADLNITEDPEETEDTLKGNAILKAKYFHKLTGITTLSDDGGFEIDALNGEPGVKSRRWLGYKMTDQELINEVIKRLQGVPLEKRTAKLLTIATVYGPKGYKNFNGGLSGLIPLKPCPKIEEGFPFRSVFWIPELKKYYVDTTEKEKKSRDHRKTLIPEIKTYLKTIC